MLDITDLFPLVVLIGTSCSLLWTCQRRHLKKSSRSSSRNASPSVRYLTRKSKRRHRRRSQGPQRGGRRVRGEEDVLSATYESTITESERSEDDEAQLDYAGSKRVRRAGHWRSVARKRRDRSERRTAIKQSARPRRRRQARRRRHNENKESESTTDEETDLRTPSVLRRLHCQMMQKKRRTQTNGGSKGAKIYSPADYFRLSTTGPAAVTGAQVRVAPYAILPPRCCDINAQSLTKHRSTERMALADVMGNEMKPSRPSPTFPNILMVEKRSGGAF